MASSEEDDDNLDNFDEFASPWPHLNAMFKCVNVSDNKICKFLCLLCSPKPKEISAYTILLLIVLLKNYHLYFKTKNFV